MLSAWVASARAATWKTVEQSSPAILYMLGIINRRPCDAVKVVVSAPTCKEPCSARLALHLHHLGEGSPDVGSTFGRPLVRQLRHGRGRSDRVDRAHFVETVGNRCRCLVPVDRRHTVGAHGRSGIISMAWEGHCWKQTAHPVHRSKSMR